jgi:DnaJ domain
MPGDPYMVLEVSRNATEAEIKASYRRLAAKYHPDRNPGFQDAANEKLKELNAAYGLIQAGGQPQDSSEPDSTNAGSNTDEGCGDASRGRQYGDAPKSQPNRRTTIATELDRCGLLEGADLEDDPTVDVLASMISRNDRIAICTGYDSFSASGQFGFREMHRSAPRIAGTLGLASLSSIPTSVSPVVRGEAILCTDDSLIWTTRRVAPVDPVWEEVSVTAYAVALVDILGSRVTGRRKREVQVWIEAGPTLTFRTARSDAEILSAYFDPQ